MIEVVVHDFDDSRCDGEFDEDTGTCSHGRLAHTEWVLPEPPC